MAAARATLDIPTTLAPEDDVAPLKEATSMDRLRAKMVAAREKAAGELTYKLPVPRMPELVVEFKPVDQKILAGILERARGQKDVSQVEINCRIIAAFCKGVWFEGDGGELVSADLNEPDKPAPRFEQRLADAVGVPWVGDYSDLVKEIYLVDGDIVSTAEAIAHHSGFGTADQIEASIRGN